MDTQQDSFNPFFVPPAIGKTSSDALPPQDAAHPEFVPPTFSMPEQPGEPDAAPAASPFKRPRGRPRKNPMPAEDSTAPDAAPPVQQELFTRPPVPRTATDPSVPGEWTPGTLSGAIPPAQPHASAIQPLNESTILSASDRLDARDEISFRPPSGVPARAAEEHSNERRENAKRIRASIDDIASNLRSVDDLLSGKITPPKEHPAHKTDTSAPQRPWQRHGKMPFSKGQKPHAPHPAPQQNRPDRTLPQDRFAPPPAPEPAPEVIRIFDLQKLSVEELLSLIHEAELVPEYVQSKHDFVLALLRNFSARGGIIEAQGYLEIWQEGFGFIRSADCDLKTVPEDVRVPAEIIARNGLRAGDFIVCRTKPVDVKQSDRRFIATELISVNGMDPESARLLCPFASLPVERPVRPISLGSPDFALGTEIDSAFPLAFGQRVIISTSRTASDANLFCKIGTAILENHPDTEVLLTFFNEAPETIEECREVKGLQVFATEFEDFADKNLQLATNINEFVRRKVENGTNVVLLLASLSSLIRSYGMSATTQQGFPSDGIDGRAVQKARRLFSAGRAVKNGGSLTIIATSSNPEENMQNQRIIDEFWPAANTYIALEGSEMALAREKCFAPDAARILAAKNHA